MRTPLTPPPLSNDCFALPPGVEWTPVDRALDLLKARLHPVVGRETSALADMAGRILAEPLLAKRAHPPTANAAVDGYGFSAGTLGTQDSYHLPLAEGRSAAGVPFEGTVPAGHALRILTGAAIPDGVDTVILQEDVQSDGKRIAFRGPIKFGSNTRQAGEDVTQGQEILPAGRILTPADIGLASAVGLHEAAIHKRLRIGILSTGDEVIEPGQPALEGQIYDANRPMLIALCQSWGYDVFDLGRAPDDAEALNAMLDGAATDCDVILTSGGASAGDEDHISALLRQSGSLTAWRIALKPGRPLALGMWQGTPIFGLPGNPVAALVCTLVFARPAFHLLSGAGWRSPESVMVPAAFSKNKKAGRREFLRARLRNGQAEVFASEGSGRISGLSWADGLVDLPEDPMAIEPGMLVRYLPFACF